jgi:hypothetical protein
MKLYFAKKVYRIVYRTKTGGYRIGRKLYKSIAAAKKVFAKSPNAKHINFEYVD